MAARPVDNQFEQGEAFLSPQGLSRRAKRAERKNSKKILAKHQIHTSRKQRELLGISLRFQGNPSQSKVEPSKITVCTNPPRFS